MDLAARLRSVEQLPETERPDALVALAREAVAAPTNGTPPDAVRDLIDRLKASIEQGVGTGRVRLELGEVLGLLGDPRLARPADAGYWVEVASELGPIVIGRYLVTNAEYRDWVDAGGYDDEAAWSPEGRAWLAACTDPWPSHAHHESSRPFVIPNQPVVGVTFWEASAYATAQGARLPRSDERVWVCRGQERRPYPWGSPFGEGNANTREEVLNRPCAVGLYLRDQTPEGVSDLAGNVAEWMADEGGDQRLIHPGAWDQPSMAAWAKALALYPRTPAGRGWASGSLATPSGFRVEAAPALRTRPRARPRARSGPGPRGARPRSGARGGAEPRQPGGGPARGDRRFRRPRLPRRAGRAGRHRPVPAPERPRPHGPPRRSRRPVGPPRDAPHGHRDAPAATTPRPPPPSRRPWRAGSAATAPRSDRPSSRP